MRSTWALTSLEHASHPGGLVCLFVGSDLSVGDSLASLFPSSEIVCVFFEGGMLFGSRLYFVVSIRQTPLPYNIICCDEQN